jgi:NAD(P)-dependent dehydrogenase (short-subunit alcohol dehydrogenase family)
VIVTGGTRGIGRGIAEAFLECGARVIVCGRQSPTQPPAAAGHAATFIGCDVRDPGSVAQLVEQVIAQHGRVDALINNAGGSPQVDAAASSPRLAEKIVQLNLLAPFYCAQAVNPFMQRQESGGAIVNISSISALRPSPGTAVYGAAKAGLVSLTQGLALEWAPKVRVNAVIAGLIATEGAAEQYGGAAGIARISAASPFRRMGVPADVASACLFLCSPLASYISGAQLAVHGAGEIPLYEHLAKLGRAEDSAEG